MQKKSSLLVSATAAVMLMGTSVGFSQVSLEHRWDMNSVNDIVGSANGELAPGAQLEGGVLIPANGDNPAGGTGNGLNLPTSAVAGLDGAFSIEVWYTRTGDGVWKTLYAFTGGAGNDTDNYLIGVQRRGDPADTQSSAFKWDGAEYLTLGDLNAVNELSQVVTTYDGAGTASFYLNGVLQGTFTNIDPAFQLSSLTTLMGIGGNSPWPDDVLEGTISDFRIYAGALDATQVSTLNGLGADATNDQIFAAVPEPEVYAMAMVGFLVLFVFGRLRRIRITA